MAVLTTNEFSQWIEFRKLQSKDSSYLDLIVEACDHFVIEYCSVRPLISDQIIEKLTAEQEACNGILHDNSPRLTEFV